MRPLSQSATQALYPLETQKVFLVLLDFDFTSLPAPNDVHLYVVNDWQNLEVNGTTYLWYPFEFQLAQENEDELPQAKLRIDNISHSTFGGSAHGIIYYIRQMTEAIPVTASIVLADSPTVLEAGPFPFYLREISYNRNEVSGTLSYEPIMDEAWPAICMNPSFAPGQFNLPTSTLVRTAAPVITGGPAEEPTTP